MKKNKYNVGDYIKCKEENNCFDWYHDNPMKIIDLHIGSEIIYYVEEGSFNDESDEIGEDLVYQDYQCKTKNREEKLKRIIALIPNDYEITYLNEVTERIEANSYENENDFFNFYSKGIKFYTVNNKLVKNIKLINNEE